MDSPSVSRHQDHIDHGHRLGPQASRAFGPWLQSGSLFFVGNFAHFTTPNRKVLEVFGNFAHFTKTRRVAFIIQHIEGTHLGTTDLT